MVKGCTNVPLSLIRDCCGGSLFILSSQRAVGSGPVRMSVVEPAAASKKRRLRSIIDQIQNADLTCETVDFNPDDVQFVLQQIKPIFQEQPMLLKVKPPITVVGDVLGDGYVVKLIFKTEGTPSRNHAYLFLGNYLRDTWHYGSLETIVLLFAHKILNPVNVLLLRGPAETTSPANEDRFLTELTCRGAQYVPLYDQFNDVFDYMPIAAIISKKIFCVHGGISRELKTVKQVGGLTRPLRYPLPQLVSDLFNTNLLPTTTHDKFRKSDKVTRIKDKLSWDPQGKVDLQADWYDFGLEALEEFCINNKIDFVARSNQRLQSGFSRLNNEETATGVTRLVTLDSTFDQKKCAAMMKIDEKLKVQFKVIEPSEGEPKQEKKNLFTSLIPWKKSGKQSSKKSS